MYLISYIRMNRGFVDGNANIRLGTIIVAMRPEDLFVLLERFSTFDFVILYSSRIQDDWVAPVDSNLNLITAENITPDL